MVINQTMTKCRECKTEANFNYDTTCENKRIMELSQDIGHRPIILIKFNPDSYTKSDKKVESCWKLNSLGVIKLDNEKEWNKRIKKLNKHIDYWIDDKHKSNKTVEIVKLFYDE